MFPSPMRDLPGPHIDGVHHRRETAPKPKEIKPLLTREPLLHDRERKPPPQPQKKRKRVIPTKPALSFDPKRSYIPSGRQDPPLSSPVFSKQSASESSTSTSSYDEQQTIPFADMQKRPRIFSECSTTERSASSASYPYTPCTEMSDMSSVPPEIYDSPASYTPSTSPAPSDHSPCAAEFAVQPPLSMSPYGGQVYVQQPLIHQDPYGHPLNACPDHPAQGYPVQYFESAYGRTGPHGIPAYPENIAYSYPPQKYYD